MHGLATCPAFCASPTLPNLGRAASDRLPRLDDGRPARSGGCGWVRQRPGRSQLAARCRPAIAGRAWGVGLGAGWHSGPHLPRPRNPDCKTWHLAVAKRGQGLKWSVARWAARARAPLGRVGKGAGSGLRTLRSPSPVQQGVTESTLAECAQGRTGACRRAAGGAGCDVRAAGGALGGSLGRPAASQTLEGDPLSVLEPDARRPEGCVGAVGCGGCGRPLSERAADRLGPGQGPGPGGRPFPSGTVPSALSFTEQPHSTPPQPLSTRPARPRHTQPRHTPNPTKPRQRRPPPTPRTPAPAP